MEVEIRDLQTLPVDRPLLQDAAEEAFRIGGGVLDAVSIVIVDDPRIRQINRSYRGTDATTDVIAFEAEDEPGQRSGEVIVSADTAARQAQEYGHSLNTELCLLVAHGVLHVLGYEDYDDAARAKMEQLQEQVLIRLAGRIEE